jgi:hypothetical protein
MQEVYRKQHSLVGFPRSQHPPVRTGSAP